MEFLLKKIVKKIKSNESLISSKCNNIDKEYSKDLLNRDFRKSNLIRIKYK